MIVNRYLSKMSWVHGDEVMRLLIHHVVKRPLLNANPRLKTEVGDLHTIFANKLRFRLSKHMRLAENFAAQNHFTKKPTKQLHAVLGHL